MSENIYIELKKEQLKVLNEIVDDYILSTINELDYKYLEEEELIQIISNLKDSKDFKLSLLRCKFDGMAEDETYIYVLDSSLRCIARDILIDKVDELSSKIFEIAADEIFSNTFEEEKNKEDIDCFPLYINYIDDNLPGFSLYSKDYDFLKKLLDDICLQIGRDNTKANYEKYSSIYEVLGID